MAIADFVLPATERQVAYARSLALRNHVPLPWEVQQDRHSLSAWIDVQAKLSPGGLIICHPRNRWLLPSGWRGSSAARCRMNAFVTRA